MCIRDSAGPLAEPSGGSEGACAPLPRAVLHALARKERDRTQRAACVAAGGQERVPLLFGLRREGVLPVSYTHLVRRGKEVQHKDAAADALEVGGRQGDENRK